MFGVIEKIQGMCGIIYLVFYTLFGGILYHYSPCGRDYHTDHNCGQGYKLQYCCCKAAPFFHSLSRLCMKRILLSDVVYCKCCYFLYYTTFFYKMQYLLGIFIPVFVKTFTHF